MDLGLQPLDFAMIFCGCKVINGVEYLSLSSIKIYFKETQH